MIHEVLVDILILAGMAAIAAGRIPTLRMNRAGIAFLAAALLILVGAIPLSAALAAIDMGTIALLLSMMILVSAIRMSGLFSIVAARLSGLAGFQRLFLASIILVSGLLSALFLNDTMCLVLGPVVAETSMRARRNPVPYLVATATAANVGSAATIIGNPQNMLIGARSGIPFVEYATRVGPPALIGLVVCWVVIMLVFPGEFRRTAASRSGVGHNMAQARVIGAGLMGKLTLDRHLAIKSVLASAAMLTGFLAGVPVVIAAMVPAAFMLASRRTESERILIGVDFNLLVFFAGLFIMTDAASRTTAFTMLARTALSGATESPWIFSAATAVISNVISNVPAVMVLSPLASAAADPHRAWLALAMASTFAGNLTLMGSVANLIVAEGAATRGARLGFWDYLKAGLPITIITIALGTAWLSLTA
ncbi:MAG TPA: anion transporter [bacterium]|nr:anion transporter [bacterium]